MNAGRDYIVEYRTTQFQQGSLVLRFDDDPSPATLRAALIRHGIPGKTLTEMSARPLDGRGARQTYEASAPQTRVPRRRKPRLWFMIPLSLVILFAVNGVIATPAIQEGRLAAQEWNQGTPEDFCWNRLSLVTRHLEPN